MKGPYDDILHLPHPTSSRHPRMSRTDRAAQFSPFAALSCHGEAVAETARVTERRMDLDEDAKAELDRRQAYLAGLLQVRPEVTVTWFLPDEKKAGGRYVTATGRLKQIDAYERVLVFTDGRRISLDDMTALESVWLPEDLPGP